MMSKTGVVAAAAALLLVVGVTLVQGRWTDRWVERRNDALDQAARRLERSFPKNFGDWTLDRDLETSKEELDRAGAVGSVSRVYRNQTTKMHISAFVVCATPHDASGHTPDRCYPGAGFEIAEPEHRQTIELRDGRIAETFTGTFAKQGQTLRVFWTYGVSPEDKTGSRPAIDADAAAAAPGTLTWLAPQIARIALNDFQAVYKLYAIIDQTNVTGPRAAAEAGDFIAQLLPEFETALKSDAASGTSREPGRAAGDGPTTEATSG